MGVITQSEAFLTGHHIGYCAVYFDQVLLAAKLSNLANKNAQDHAKNMIVIFKYKNKHYFWNLHGISCRTV